MKAKGCERFVIIRYQFSYDTVIELIVMQELGKNAFLHLCIAHKWVLYSFLFRGC